MPQSDQPWDPEFRRKSPLFQPFAALLDELGAKSTWPTLADYVTLVERRRLTQAPDLPALDFAPPPKRSRRSPRPCPIRIADLYDGSIALERCVPCLPASYHDLFNVLIWAAFPRAKHTLHARQYRALTTWVDPEAHTLPSKRTREQDALTVFDEGGSVLVMNHDCHGRWKALTPSQRQRVVQSEATVLTFGHALLEHVLYGRPAVRSAAVVVVLPEPVPSGLALLDAVDPWLSKRLSDRQGFTRPGADTVVQIDDDGSVWAHGPA